MYLQEDYGTEVYEKITELFKMKFKTHLKGSKIKFEQICSAKDLLTGEELIFIILSDSVIRCKDKKSFVYNFALYVKRKINEVGQQLQEIEGHRCNDRYFDKHAYYHERELLSEEEYRLGKLYAFFKKKHESNNN